MIQAHEMRRCQGKRTTDETMHTRQQNIVFFQDESTEKAKRESSRQAPAFGIVSAVPKNPRFYFRYFAVLLINI